MTRSENRQFTIRPIRLADYRPPDWLVDTVHLDVSLHPTATRVRATLSVRPNPAVGAPGPLVLDGDELALVSVGVNGQGLPADRYAATPDELTIADTPGGPFTLEIETRVDPTANTQLSGLYLSGGTYCTQCEAEGFRRITYFPDRPDVMAVYTTRIEADASAVPVLLANGNPIDQGALADGRHFAVWHDPFPKPSYLFALVGGRLGCLEDHVVTRSGRRVALRLYVEPGKEDRCAHAMASLKHAMRWDEERFGREYDLDIFMIVAVSDFNMGAMENKGLNVFNDKYILASPDTATDADFRYIDAIVAHEYFHNWTGNRITCRDWFQLCLKEGLTVFREHEYVADRGSRTVARIAVVRALQAGQFVEDAGPLAHPVRPEVYTEINNFYTTTVYEKGAEVVRMIQTLLGPERFRQGMDLYFQRHDGEAATVDQFVQCFADAGERDLSQFMRWYAQAGTPEVTARGQHDGSTASYRLDLRQKVPPTPNQPEKAPMLIPLGIGLVGADGRDVPLRPADGRVIENGLLVLDRESDRIVFTGVVDPPVLSLNRDFSAPIRLRTDRSPDDLRRLAAFDSDLFNRWQAVQTLAMTLLVGNVERLDRGDEACEDAGLLAALEVMVVDASLEPAFVAEVLQPPGEADIAREIGHDVNPEAVYRARASLRGVIGRHLAGALRKASDRLATPGPYSPDPASAGRRALRHMALDLLVAASEPGAIEQARALYRSADNMTDRMAALTTLNQHDGPDREASLADFEARYRGNALVLDKWFLLQATAPHLDTLQRVQGLTGHPAFSMANPNRVRALIGSFAHFNPRQFNRADGEGYAFVAGRILDLDPANPQAAARLATSFRSWRMLDSGRRARAEAALRRIAAAPGLSRDVADIVARALETSADERNG
jgi:aminopeptidase N